MASLLDLNSDASDSEDDCDYVPPAGEVSDDASDNDISGDEVELKTSKKTNRKKKNDDISEDSDHEKDGGKELTAEEEKHRADNLWQSFIKDVPQKSKVTSNNSNSNGKQNATSTLTDLQPSKVTVTEVYEYAGEKVTVTKEVDAKLTEPPTTAKTALAEPSGVSKAPLPGESQKRPVKGLSSVLGTLTKKQKLSTLQKSMLDWKKFKDDEGIEEELEHHNKGKKGFLENQAFLQRSDVRQFEIEKNLRLSKRTKF